ncbi:hypothetical protein FXW78_07065 [Rhodococcus opacus]|nr:hypothetical protein [Rhodococcus opacus]
MTDNDKRTVTLVPMTEIKDDSEGAYVSADDFLNDRTDWLEVAVVEVEKGCFDVMLKIDGTYFDRETADESREAFVDDLRALLPKLDPTRFLCPPEVDQ